MEEWRVLKHQYPLAPLPRSHHSAVTSGKHEMYAKGRGNRGKRCEVMLFSGGYLEERK